VANRLYKVGIRNSKNGKGLVALQSIREGDILLDLSREAVFHTPTRESFQIGEGKHVVTLKISFLNHSCAPNAFLDSDRVAIRAMRDIPQGEEITANYLATEYDMSSVFRCRCGSPACFGKIRGFKYLSRARRNAISQYLASHLRQLTNTHRAAKPAAVRRARPYALKSGPRPARAKVA
jgi:hypothetical protein